MSHALPERTVKVLILEARYDAAVAAALVDGATLVLEKGGAQFARIALPGVLELPAALAIAVQEGAFDGFVALGAVIGRETVHDAIYRETLHGISALAATGLAIGNGVILAENEAEALELAEDGDAGGDAARACLALLSLKTRLSYL